MTKAIKAIEAGKFYRCRDGSKARIYATDAGGLDPIHGARWNEVTWVSETWDEEGCYSVNSGATPFDLVSEWEEPKPSRIAYIDDAGYVCLFLPEKQPETEHWKRMPHLDEPKEEEK